MNDSVHAVASYGVRSLCLVLACILVTGTIAAGPPALTLEPGPARPGSEYHGLDVGGPYRRTLHLLPDSFIDMQTEHFILLSDVAISRAREHGQRLEATWKQFHRMTRRLGLHPEPLRHKLLCVLFADREAFRRFAREQDAVKNTWVAGYYSPAHDRIVFYDPMSNPSVLTARTQLDDMAKELRALDARINEADRRQNDREKAILVDYRHRCAGHLALESQRVDAFAERVLITTTLHEVSHQLLFHTGVQNEHARYPLWISEGLATAFETDSPNDPFGPDHDYRERRAGFTQLLADEGLIPLAELITIFEIPHEQEDTVFPLYHQSYALVSWLSRYRPHALAAYLESYRASGSRRLSQRDHALIFETAFGPVRQLERDWIQYEQRDTAALPSRSS